MPPDLRLKDFRFFEKQVYPENSMPSRSHKCVSDKHLMSLLFTKSVISGNFNFDNNPPTFNDAILIWFLFSILIGSFVLLTYTKRSSVSCNISSSIV